MSRTIIVYESKYGNTRLVAEKIAERVREVPGTEVSLKELKGLDPNELDRFDAILVGSPNHMGNATRGIRKLIDRLGELKAEGKSIAVFDTCLAGDYEKAVKKMERQIERKAPELKILAPGLSIRVEGMKGPIREGELPKSREFGDKIASRLEP